MKITISTDEGIVMDVITIKDGERPDGELEDWNAIFQDEHKDIGDAVIEAVRVAYLNQPNKE